MKARAASDSAIQIDGRDQRFERIHQQGLLGPAAAHLLAAPQLQMAADIEAPRHAVQVGGAHQMRLESRSSPSRDSGWRETSASATRNPSTESPRNSSCSLSFSGEPGVRDLVGQRAVGERAAQQLRVRETVSGSRFQSLPVPRASGNGYLPPCGFGGLDAFTRGRTAWRNRGCVGRLGCANNLSQVAMASSLLPAGSCEEASHTRYAGCGSAVDGGLQVCDGHRPISCAAMNNLPKSACASAISPFLNSSHWSSGSCGLGFGGGLGVLYREVEFLLGLGELLFLIEIVLARVLHDGFADQAAAPGNPWDRPAEPARRRPARGRRRPSCGTRWLPCSARPP